MRNHESIGCAYQAFKLPLDLAYRAIAVQALISRGLGVLVVALGVDLDCICG